MKRVVSPELLDTDSGTPAEIAASLADLRWINRNFGGISTTSDLLRRIASKAKLQRISFLDVAGASGDVAVGAQQTLRSKAIDLQTTVLDRAPAHLVSENGLCRISGDALRLPFGDNSFDVVGSALFIHHLEPREIIAAVNEALRVARVACVVNDLQRSYFHLLAVHAGSLLYKSHITTHDSVASVRRAYTESELRNILQKTSHSSLDFSSHFFCRMGVIIWKRGAHIA